MTEKIRPGTVLVIRSKGWAGSLIRFGAAIRGNPNLQNHVAVAHHTDATGTLWCIEGRPGGVGWRDATSYLESAWTVTNAAQPFTEKQGASVAAQMEGLLGTAYDWSSICADALADLGMRLPGWDSRWHGLAAGQVVCSSAAAYAYGKAGVPHPPGDRGCQPSSWSQWILTRAWLTGMKKPPPLMRGRFFHAHITAGSRPGGALATRDAATASGRGGPGGSAHLNFPHERFRDTA